MSEDERGQVPTRAKRALTRAIYLVDRAYGKSTGWARYGIKRQDLVVDVGSGSSPFPRADILVDKFLLDNLERPRRQPLTLDRPLVVADGCQLPFRDQTFDFSYSSHLLEHVMEPERVLLELQRISRRGVIITPSEAWEHLYPSADHRWAVNSDENTLWFREKEKVAFDEFLEAFAHSPGTFDHYGLRFFFNYFHDVFEVHHQWEGTIAFEVKRVGASYHLHPRDLQRTREEFDISEVSSRMKLESALSKMVRRLFSAHYSMDIWRLLVCPACLGSLERRRETIRCEGCRRQYGIYRGVVPVLLLE